MKNFVINDAKLKARLSTLKQPEDVMKFFDDFIQYGCVDVDYKEHIDSLGGNEFREKYRTLGLEDTLKYKIGACIEQTNVTKFLLDCMKIRNRMFCTRGYNEEHKTLNDPYLVHCFTLAYYDDKVLNIEHSDSEKMGVYVYDTEKEAIEATHKIFSDKFISHGATRTELYEYFDFVPSRLSFLEFNKFISEHGIKIVMQ